MNMIAEQDPRSRGLYENIPAELKELPQWVCWKPVEKTRPDGSVKTDKVPIDLRTGEAASVHNSANWNDFQTAKEFSERTGYGVGLALTTNDPFCCIDLDKTEDTADPVMKLVHQGILDKAREAGAYVEKSPSGKGWHIWAKTDALSNHPKEVAGVECYTHRQFITVTGDGQGQPVPLPKSLETQLAPCFAPPAEQAPPPVDYLPSADDADVLAKAKERYGEQFSRLWAGQWDQSSQSEADLHLGIMLARYTADEEQWRHLFLESGLADTLDRKPKPEDYLRRTYKEARIKADRENYFVQHGKEIWDAIQANAATQKKEAVDGLLVPFGEFIKRKATPLRLVRGLLGAGNLSVLYGPPGAGKSFLALDLCYALATGQPWMERQTLQGPVIYAAGEGQSGLTQRVKAVHQKKGGNEEPPIVFLPHALGIPDKEDGEKLTMAVEQVAASFGRDPALLIIDTLNRYFGDEGDENSAKDMKRFVGALSNIMATHPAMHVMLVHHSGKDADKGMRGSSALQGAADTVIQCNEDQGRHVARIEKQKDGAGGIVLPFKLDPVDLGYDEDGEPITSCVVTLNHEGRPKEFTDSQYMAIRILHQLKQTATSSGNLGTEIARSDYYRLWYAERPKAKPDSVRKSAARYLEDLKDDWLALEWPGKGDTIRLLPAFDSLPSGAV